MTANIKKINEEKIVPIFKDEVIPELEVEEKPSMEDKEDSEDEIEEKPEQADNTKIQHDIAEYEKIEIGDTEEDESISEKKENIFKKYRGEFILGLSSVIVILSVVLVYLKFGTDFFRKEESQVKKMTVFEARKQNLAKEEMKKPEIKPAILPENVNLRIVAAETTWVRMIKDEMDTNEYMFYPGNIRTFEANENFELRMGRADGLFLWINDDSIGVLGTAADIVYKLVIDTNGIVSRELRSPSRRTRPTKPDTSIQE